MLRAQQRQQLQQARQLLGIRNPGKFRDPYQGEQALEYFRYAFNDMATPVIYWSAIAECFVWLGSRQGVARLLASAWGSSYGSADRRGGERVYMVYFTSELADLAWDLDLAAGLVSRR